MAPDTVSNVLTNNGFTVQRTTSVPSDLTPYNLVVVGDIGSSVQSSLSTIESYIRAGGGYVYIAGAAYWSQLSSNANWLGASSVGYTGYGWNATVAANNPFGTSLLQGAVLKQQASNEWGAQWVSGLQLGATQVASWTGGYTFAYAYAYGTGKVLYFADTNPSQAGSTGQSNIDTLLGAGFTWAASAGASSTTTATSSTTSTSSVASTSTTTASSSTSMVTTSSTTTTALGSIFTLPVGAYTPSFAISNEVTLLSSNTQTVSATPGQSASFTVTYNVHSGSNPSQVTQALFAVSWAPNWPPSAGYYFPMYNGIPGLAPGINQTQVLTVTAPSTPGTYYIWFLMGSFYNMQDAVNSYTNEPPLPAHLKIVVSPFTTTSTTTASTTASTTAITTSSTSSTVTPSTSSTTYTVTFSESGLQVGTSWSVNFDGSTHMSTASQIMIPGVSPGTHSWTAMSPIYAASDVRYSALQTSGTVSVPSYQSVQITYQTEYSVSLSANPTNGGTVYFAGVIYTVPIWFSPGSTIFFSATVNSGNTFAGWTSSTSQISIASPTLLQTTATVYGPGTITADFASASSTYSVLFSANGLPSGYSWPVMFNGQTYTTSTGSITIPGVGTGSYSWSIPSVVSYGGNVRYVTSQSNGVLSVPSSFSVAVTYGIQYLVSLYSNPIYGGKTNPSGPVWVAAGGIISFTETPSSGYIFSSWSTTASLIEVSSQYIQDAKAVVNGPGGIAANFVSTSSCLSASSIQMQLTRVQASSFVKGPIVNVNLINSCYYDANHLLVSFFDQNTRNALYGVDLYETNPTTNLMQYDSTMFLDSGGSAYFAQSLNRCVYCDKTAFNSEMDVNIAAGVYIVSYTLRDILGFSPSDQDMWQVTQAVKQEYFPTVPFLDIDPVQFATALGNYMLQNPPVFVQLALGSDISYTEGRIIQFASQILAKVLSIVDAAEQVYMALTTPSEETLWITLTDSSTPSISTVVTLSEPGQKIYLSVSDSSGRRVGFDSKTNSSDMEIPGATYTDTQRRIIITLPGNATEYHMTVDATRAAMSSEVYNLTVASVSGGAVLEQRQNSNIPISRGQLQSYDILPSQSQGFQVVELSPNPNPLIWYDAIVIAGTIIFVGILIAFMIRRRSEGTPSSRS